MKTLLDRATQLRGLTVSLGSGTEPEVIELEDCHQVYGDSLDLFPAIEERCDYSPSGQCEYGGPQDRECKWCRKPSGLDR